MAQFDVQAFLASLPEVETGKLPLGTMFVANGLIYQITEAGGGDFRKARQWRGGEESEVALVPGAYLANFLPLVARGRLLPVFPTRTALTKDGAPIRFLFPEERQALDAAYLDVALVKEGGVYVRNHGREPAFIITDGANLFRAYYYSRSVSGQATTLVSDATRQTIEFQPYYRGPIYWRLLPTWAEAFGAVDETRPSMRPVIQDRLSDQPFFQQSSDDEATVHNPAVNRREDHPTQKHNRVDISSDDDEPKRG